VETLSSAKAKVTKLEILQSVRRLGINYCIFVTFDYADGRFFLLRLELCAGSSFADYGGVSLFPLTTKYLEKFNGNHNYNLENPIVASHFSKTFWYL
jgi:hypothetical protein